MTGTRRVGFWEAVGHNMKLSEVFSTGKGRAGRREFLCVALFSGLCVSAVAGLSFVLHEHCGLDRGCCEFGGVCVASYFLYALVSCMTRRLYDTGNNAWPLNLSLNLTALLIPLWIFRPCVPEQIFKVSGLAIVGVAGSLFACAFILCFRGSKKEGGAEKA